MVRSGSETASGMIRARRKDDAFVRPCHMHGLTFETVHCIGGGQSEISGGPATPLMPEANRTRMVELPSY
jgi:hypothetical protein